MNPYIEILRPGNALMGAITIILVALIDKTLSIPVILAMAAVFFETAAGNVINDYFDYNIDLINKPERPIPSGRISLASAALGISTREPSLISPFSASIIPSA